MAICPNCGTNNNDGSKFCYNCGGPIPAGQPAPQPQPAQQAVPQAPEGFQPIPEPSNGGFIPITPTNPLPNMTPIQPSYAQPITQPVQKPINKPKSNGFCNWGLALSIIGLCTLGSTSLLGLIFSVIGFFSARKKNQPGTGKAIVGTIMSGLIVIGLGFTFAICWNDLTDEFESGAISNPIEFIYALDHANDRNTSEYKEKLKVITDQISLSQQDLIKEGAKALGFPRLGSKIQAVMEEAIRFSASQGLIHKGSNGFWTT